MRYNAGRYTQPTRNPGNVSHLSFVGASARESHERVLVGIWPLQGLRHLTNLWLPCDTCQLSSFPLILSQLSLHGMQGAVFVQFTTNILHDSVIQTLHIALRVDGHLING